MCSSDLKNPQYDQLVAQFVAAIDIGSQRKLSGQIQTLLLDETPIIIPFFYDQLIAMRSGVNGMRFTALAQLYFDRVTLAA